PEYTQFCNELEGNNHKLWVDENRDRYENFVKKPFDNLIKDLLNETKIDISHSKCIFRINRDVRFSKDKSLYKLNRSAIVSPFGTKDKSYPGMYFEINANVL